MTMEPEIKGSSHFQEEMYSLNNANTCDLFEVTGMPHFSQRACNSCNNSFSSDCMSTSKSNLDVKFGRARVT